MGYHRLKNYWEPTYDGKTEYSSLSAFNWAILFSSTGPNRSTCNWGDYQDNHKLIADKKFNICDFIGDLSNITFKDCDFKSCFWNRYEWKKIKFQNCKFEKCSFSFANFIECQFFKCTFCDIGMSGNETVFIDCIIDSKKLIASAYTNTEAKVLRVHEKSQFGQKARLEKTKSEVAQKLYRLNNKFSEYYYSSIEVAVLQEIKARIFMRFYDNNKFIYWCYKPLLLILTVVDVFELIIMFLSGKFFGWGESFFKCVFSGLFIVALFGGDYHYIKYPNHDWFDSFLRAFDITVIAGYSKYGTKDMPPVGIAELLNLGFGIFWYSIAIPAITNKLTRTRY